MSEIILDYSANTHKNDLSKIADMINSIANVDTGKHDIVFKSQLFESSDINVVCSRESFNFMYSRCKELGYQCTASVFDIPSLDYLIEYDVPFVKIANQTRLHYLIKYIPRYIPIYISANEESGLMKDCLIESKDKIFFCISQYPATLKSYDDANSENISDHTVGLTLFKNKKPKIWEKHIKMQNDKGLDAGSFSITPQELKEIL